MRVDKIISILVRIVLLKCIGTYFYIQFHKLSENLTIYPSTAISY